MIEKKNFSHLISLCVLFSEMPFFLFVKATEEFCVICVRVSAWQCKFDGGYNTSPFLPSFLPSLRECYHSIFLPGTLSQICRWGSRYELCAAQSDTLCTVEGKWERNGDLATRIKLSWYFQEAKTLFETNACFHEIEDRILLWRETNPVSPPHLSLFSLVQGDWFEIATAWSWGLTFLFFPPSSLAVDMAWRVAERTAWWCLCWVCGGCPRPH